MMNMSAPLDPIVMQALPKGSIMLSSEGNVFEIVVEEKSVRVNGVRLVSFAVVTGLHGMFLSTITGGLKESRN
jgi:hypothetical protein